MATMRLRGQENGTTAASEQDEQPGAVPLPEMSIEGIVIRWEALEQTLRVWIPNIDTIEVLQPGERLLLKLRAPGIG